jgi:hypothetical protein
MKTKWKQGFFILLAFPFITLFFILYLSTPEDVRPACLPNVGVNLNPERNAWTTGWGTLSSGGDPKISLSLYNISVNIS